MSHWDPAANLRLSFKMAQSNLEMMPTDWPQYWLATKGVELNKDLIEARTTLHVVTSRSDPLAALDKDKISCTLELDLESAVGPKPEPPVSDALFAPDPGPPPGFISRLLGGTKRYHNRVAAARRKGEIRLEAARREFETEYEDWRARAAAARQNFEAAAERERSKVAETNGEIERQKRRINEGYAHGDANIVNEYFRYVFDLLQEDLAFESLFRLPSFFHPQQERIVIEPHVPFPKDVIPSMKGYKEVKKPLAWSNERYAPVVRTDREIESLYIQFLLSLALRIALHAFKYDPMTALSEVVINFKRPVEHGTQNALEWRYIWSVKMDRARCEEVTYSRDPLAHMRRLGGPFPAGVASTVGPIEVKPLIDPHAAATASNPEDCCNLLDLDPVDFEDFLGDLFVRMGCHVETTKRTGDGGIDLLVVDPRPVVGGTSLVQAKRYSGTVGVAFVRELYGTLINHGAGKGILITTGRYSSGAHDFAAGKPIELLDGDALLSLCERYGLSVTICE